MSRTADEPQPAGLEERPSAARWKELRPRVGSAVILMAAALGSAYVGGLLFDLFWLAASAGVLWEWLRLVGNDRRVPVFACGTAVLTGGAALAAAGLPLGAVGLVVGGAAMLAVGAAPKTRAMSAAGLLYAGALIVSVTILRHSAPFGREAIVFLFAVVWGTDCMAYFGGRLIGGAKLAPRFSPSKTWSGFLVGVASGAGLGWAVAPAPACLGCMLLLGLLAGAIAQAGDVGESIVKRRFNVKDSGGLIPGHGGLMDRLDGFVAASFFAVCLGVWRFGAGAAGTGLFRW